MPRTRLPRHLAVSLGAMLFISCSNPQWVCGCSPVDASPRLFGRVTDPSGAGVPGATVVIEGAGESCPAAYVGPLGAVQTQADGRYGMLVRAPRPPAAQDCLRVHAQPPQGSALVGSDTVPFTVRFDLAAPDSVTVDLSLRAP